MVQPSTVIRPRRAPSLRRGSVLLYATLAIVVLLGVASLAIEYGQAQLAANQLQAAADTAARYAAGGVKHQIGGVNAAIAMARASLAENSVNGQRLVDAQSTIQVGVWSTSQTTFAASSDVSVINAVRVTVRCDGTTGTQVATPLGSVIGKNGQDLSATATALYDADSSATYVSKYVPATSNPFLAGSPAGTVASANNPHNNPDYAGGGLGSVNQSPVAMDGLRLAAGTALTFDGVNGGATNDTADTNRYTGDGNLGWNCNNSNGAENGKTDMVAPINCVVAVFLTDATPTSSTTLPPTLDFSTPTSRDFATLSPQLNQTFFVGDGRRDNGDLQRFVVPGGATRVIVGTWDAYEWNNNAGGFTVNATSPAKITLVK